MCQFSYYKNEKSEMAFPQLYCHLKDKDNGVCSYRKRCDKEGKFVLMDGETWKECYIMNEYLESKSIPRGSYKVKSYHIGKSGNVKLYVDFGGTVIKIDSPNNKVLEYVYIKEENGNYLAFLENPNIENNKEEGTIEKIDTIIKQDIKKSKNNRKKKK